MSTSATVTSSVDADGIGWLTFDDPAGRANVFNPPTMASLRTATEKMAGESVKAVVLISAKEKIFVAGADLRWLGALADPRAALQASKEGQALFTQLEKFKVPVVCAIHGACAGGGMEMALACHWRIATDARETVIGLPEVGVGLIPGWGGCARLPRLIGGKAATEHILKAQLVPAKEAHAAGFIDEIVPAKDLRARAKAAALKLADSGKPSRMTAAPADPAYFSDQRRSALSRMRGQPAPLAALDAIEKGHPLPLPAALELEAAMFSEVAPTDVARNLIHVFFLKDTAKKLSLDAWFPGTPAVAAPAPFRMIGIIGAGVMGSGIAQWCASRGFGVMINDSSHEALKRGVEVIRGLFEDAVKRGRMDGAAAHKAMGSIGTTTELIDFDACDLVIEAVVENVAVKQEIFAKLSKIVPPDCVLASNTSALPIEEIAASAINPERAIGIHFFNPVSRMPLVELILGRQTSRATAERTLAFTRALGKTPVVCRSSPGFLVTRVLFFYLNEACLLWEEGVPTEALDRAMRSWGWPMGPMRLIDEVGVDVTDFIFGEMEHYFPDRFRRASVTKRMLGADLKGRKNGDSSGFYSYNGLKESANAAMKPFEPGQPREMSDKEIQERLNGVMISETKRVLDEGVLKSADEADLALLLGAGFPAFRGGLMRFWKKAGVS